MTITSRDSKRLQKSRPESSSGIHQKTERKAIGSHATAHSVRALDLGHILSTMLTTYMRVTNRSIASRTTK